MAKHWREVEFEERQKKAKKIATLLVFGAVIIFGLGMLAQHKIANQMLYQEVKQLKTLMKDYPNSIIVLPPEVAKITEWKARPHIDEDGR